MATKAQILIPISIAAIIIGIAGVITVPTETMLQSTEFPKGTVKVDDVVIVVEIADTPAAQARGLMFKEQLPYEEGMLFVFKDMQIRSMWMLNMQFPLDIMWFDSEGNVVHIEKDTQPCKSALETATCTFQNGAGEDAQYVLEVTAGFVDKFGITKDSKLEIISI